MTLPELTAPAECYYNEERSKEYHNNSRINKIQTEITERAIELLDVPESELIIDLGCGSGLSGQILHRYGHVWVGVDISPAMASISSNMDSKMNGCLSTVISDIGTKLPFKDETFGYAISISAVQWLLQSYKTEDVPAQRIRTCFRELYRIIRRRAVLQFYSSKKGTKLLAREAAAAGFYGGIVIDKEGTKNEKKFLVLDKNKVKNSKERKQQRK